MDTTIIMDFLTELSQNNDREWYHAHNAAYREANAQFEMLLQDLIYRIGETDDSILHNRPKDITFKMVRDTRFSHDKTPYNPAFRAHIAAKGKLPVPVGYYIMLKPNQQSFLGGGLFADMFADATTMIRDFIAANSDEWKSILSDPSFRAYFEVRGTALKKVPNGYDKNHPQAEYLKFKNWYLEYPVDDETVRDAEKLLDLSVDVFRRMKPFQDYLNRALVHFKMPERK